MNIVNDPRYIESHKRVCDAMTLDKLKVAKDISSTIEGLPKEYKVYRETYDNGEGYWSYTKIVVKLPNGEEMFMCRNYSGAYVYYLRLNDMDYIISGEDYQGITVLNLTLGKSNTYIDSGWLHGNGFCITNIEDFDVDTNVLIVEGCYWGGQYEYVSYHIEDLDNINLDTIIDSWDKEYEEDDE